MRNLSYPLLPNNFSVACVFNPVSEQNLKYSQKKKEIHLFTFTDIKLQDVCYSDPSVEMCNPGNQENWALKEVAAVVF